MLQIVGQRGNFSTKHYFFDKQGMIKMKLFSVLMFEVAETQCLVLPQHKLYIP